MAIASLREIAEMQAADPPVLPAEILSALERLHHESPGALAAFVGWIVDPRPYQSVTLRFNAGRLFVAERTESAK